jgi:tetratricopeptide (TPR) repeat protein
MDCRKPAALAFGLLLGGMGCTHLETVKESNVAPPDGVEVRKEADKPKRQPQPATLVSFGNLYEKTARDENTPPDKRDQLLEQARKSYQQALKIDPKHVPALLALARLYESTDDHTRALATYTKALKEKPKDASIWCDLGMAHARRKEWDQAVTALRKATELDPEDKQYCNYLGFTLARAGMYEESYSAFRKTQGEGVAHYNVARMLQHVQQVDLSKQHLRLALEADPRLAQAQQMLAQLESPNPSGGAQPAGNVMPAGFESPAGSPQGN